MQRFVLFMFRVVMRALNGQMPAPDPRRFAANMEKSVVGIAKFVGDAKTAYGELNLGRAMNEATEAMEGKK